VAVRGGAGGEKGRIMAGVGAVCEGRGHHRWPQTPGRLQRKRPL